MLLNKGRHPTTNETVVPEDVVEHVAHGVSVARGKAPYPELVRVLHILSSFLTLRNRARRYTAAVKIALLTEVSGIPDYGRDSDFRALGYEIIEHGGSNPGFKTQVSRFPNNNLGVVVLSNDENGGHILESVKWRIVDHIFGLEPIDWAQRYSSNFSQEYT